MKFHNEELQREIDRIEGDLEELGPQAKQVAHDIAKLEETLKKKGFCIQISIFSHSSRSYMVGEDASFTETSEYVEWDKLGEEWRLILRREEGHGDLVLGDHCHYSDTLDKTPLIDADTAIQLRANLVLGQFVKEVGDALRGTRPGNSDFTDWLENEAVKENMPLGLSKFEDSMET